MLFCIFLLCIKIFHLFASQAKSDHSEAVGISMQLCINLKTPKKIIEKKNFFWY